MQELEKENQLYKVRHSLAHVLAQAVQKKFPNVKLGFGPPVEHGFYYDFDFGDEKLTEEDFKDIEKDMRKIIGQKQDFVRADFDEKTVLAEIAKFPKETYKNENITNLIERGETHFSFYQNGPFIDLCRGPHVANTGELPANGFKLSMVAGAYWLGSEKNQMLTRIYAFAFESQEELKQFLDRKALAEQFDHKKLGKELQIFMFSELVGKGLTMWLPNGAVIRDEIEKYAKEVEFQYGYQRVNTPHITKKELYLTSQHLPAYEESMFPPLRVMGAEGEVEEELYLKPMNCPHHHLIFDHAPKSYRDLPIRLAEYGTCYRYEQSGELSGLIRVRCLTMNDAHIYIRQDQFEEEFKSIVKMYQEMYATFKLSEFKFRLSVRSDENREKYKGDPKMWDKAEGMLKKALDDMNMDYYMGEGEAAFYGPKIDIQFRNLMGREETVSTIQVDFLAAENFNLSYINENNEEERPIVIHRAPLSTHERFISFLLEYYGGAFPTWCSPTQVIIIPVNDDCLEYCQELEKDLRAKMVRVKIDTSNASFNKKIRTNTIQKNPNILIIGNKEVEDRTVTLRRYGFQEQIISSKEEFTKDLLEEISTRKMLREPMGSLL